MNGGLTMIKYYAVLYGKLIECKVSKKTIEETYYKLSPSEYQYLNSISSGINYEYDEATVELMKQILHAGTLHVLSKLKIISAITAREFIVEQKLNYVHVLPGNNGYLNVQSDNIFLGDLEERDDTKTIFDELEIKKMRHDGRFRGIDFDHCLEEVKYDD